MRVRSSCIPREEAACKACVAGVMGGGMERAFFFFRLMWWLVGLSLVLRGRLIPRSRDRGDFRFQWLRCKKELFRSFENLTHALSYYHGLERWGREERMRSSTAVEAVSAKNARPSISLLGGEQVRNRLCLPRVPGTKLAGDGPEAPQRKSGDPHRSEVVGPAPLMSQGRRGGFPTSP